MRLAVVCLVVVGFLTIFTTAVTAATPKPYQWTPAQASAYIRGYSEDIAIDPETTLPQNLVAISCRGTGKKIMGRFVAFRCPATVKESRIQALPRKVTFLAKTRRAGGLCFSATGVVPSKCLAAGKRGRGSVDGAFQAMAHVVGIANQNFRCLANGAGFYSCSWTDAAGAHRGTVVFAPSPIAKVLS